MINPIPQPSLRDSALECPQRNDRNLTWTQLSNNSGAAQARKCFNGKSQHENDCRVAVILGYYNGNHFAIEQIRSILDQSHHNLQLFISDDCSSSGLDINALGLDPYDVEKICLGIRQHNIGFTNNFLNALSSIDVPFKYFAFSDQDDVWHHDKIKNALTVLEQHPIDQPVLYCARTAITDEDCQRDLGRSPLFDKLPSFANSLVQNIGGGNTMVFNKAARDLIVTSITETDIVSHDWWCYQIISGAGGVVHYDPKPCLKYRQHSDNLVGANTSWIARLVRIQGLLKGRFRNWNDINLAALSQNRALLTQENQRCLDDFIAARQSNLFKRLFLFKRSGIYRQTFLGNLALLLGFVINKI